MDILNMYGYTALSNVRLLRHCGRHQRLCSRQVPHPPCGSQMTDLPTVLRPLRLRSRMP